MWDLRTIQQINQKKAELDREGKPAGGKEVYEACDIHPNGARGEATVPFRGGDRGTLFEHGPVKVEPMNGPDGRILHLPPFRLGQKRA